MNSINVLLPMLLLAVVSSVAHARVSAGLFRHPEHPGKCHIDGSNIMEEGEVSMNHNGKCQMVTCFKNGHATMMRCVNQKMRDGCVEGDILKPNAPFPECCKREIKCNSFYYSPSF